MPRSSKVAEAALRAAVAESLAVAQVISKLRLVLAGGNYKNGQKRIKYTVSIPVISPATAGIRVSVTGRLGNAPRWQIY
jgi:hypothetical protein